MRSGTNRLLPAAGLVAIGLLAILAIVSGDMILPSDKTMATDTPGKRANDIDVEGAVTGATYAQQTEGGKLRLVVIRGLPQRFDLEGCRKVGSAALCEAQATEYEAMRRKYISERSGQAPSATDLRAGFEASAGNST